ncbi:prolyl oligopeptidase family serine peptidase [Flavobacterium sp.]|uniref:alpha/beta hydrolase family protein n=1 Tax=Flavobacterium sp. TaxID=239 RepID=UPI003F69D679
MKKVISILFLCFGFFSLAQENLTYQTPPKEILALADYEITPSISMDKDRNYMLLSYRNTYKTLDDLNQSEMKLGGLRINPDVNIGSSTLYLKNLKIRKLKDKVETQVAGLPENAKIANTAWSPDYKTIAFTNSTNSGVELWLIDVVSAKARKLTEANLNGNVGSPFSWFNDSQNLLVRVLPNNKPSLINKEKAIPTGPSVSSSDGSKSQNRTYQDLLKNKTDEANFESLITSELYKINTNGSSTLFKKADMYVGENFSPDGKYIMINTVQKPFSYIVTVSRFPLNSIVYDVDGNLIKVVNEVPLDEIRPKGFMATRASKRSMGWRSDKPASLSYVLPLDGGDPAVDVAFRDEVFSWDAPFNNEPVSVLKTKDRYAGIVWGTNDLAVAYDSWYDTRNTRTYLFNPSDSSVKPSIISDRNSQDIYSDPGNFETKKNEFNKEVLLMNNGNLYLIGEGHTKEGQFPFIDEFNIKTLKSKRLYTSKYTDKIERLLSIEDINKGNVIINLQSKNEFPNYYFRNLKSSKITPITTFQNPFESIKDVYKEVIKYKRKDGVELSGTLYLPVGYERNKKEKLPLLIWAYPEEYKDKNSAGQSALNENEFTYPYYGSFVYWVTRGYAVLDDASFPIVGEGTSEPNDTFIDQLIMNSEAAINALDDLGYINREKVAIGGHSYGAFMTANLLTHSNLFACGIARSGAYNRTLTPFGFQSEQRNYWDAPEVYNTMSPFMNAHKMKTPLLLVHGEADNNPGTFTLQTERYFQALKGMGAPARMVLLPKESHSYVAKENIFHLLWEQDQFLEKHLKN